ncbi:Head domain of trimeric autotransporter adhesin [Dyadobacter sp. SG02]|uniref:tail fiber domain-containing protein n=1 Tax=Dyadobacter sp. SG02 TaxID=1855291 RepID=UPI0008BB90A8|nr:tail fiber domain-containing protein [Dyadobacter sp. SG02]SEJ12386.1 Head domain of trimeric autotransporter adhesin [Dyadobacter sp. SG02]
MKNPATHSPGPLTHTIAPGSFASKIRKAFSRRPQVILVILLSVSLFLRSQPLLAQAPQQFSFQGVARGADGKILANKSIGYSFKIHSDNPGGIIKFTREGVTTTDAAGVFSATIGTEASPIPSDIRWDRAKHYLEVGIDVDGAINGTTFVSVGTTELISVPSALYAQHSGKWTNGSPVVQTDDNGGYGNMPSFPTVGNGARLIWHPGKAAFRVGHSSSDGFWEDALIGNHSFATGEGTKASGQNSAAMGYKSQALGSESVAIGSLSTAYANFSVSIGNNALASGLSAISLGESTSAIGSGAFAAGVRSITKSLGGISIGMYNDNNDNPNSVAPSATDRLLQVGNGSSLVNRSNAITVLRNGNVGIGNNVLVPQYTMDFGGRTRIRHNGATAGIYFNNSQNLEEGFVGMVNDDEVGLYVGDAWRLIVNKNGTVFAQKFQSFSDRRLKTAISPVKNSLAKLRAVQGYNYQWKNPKDDQDLQTGVVAQELEEKFPELVSTGKDGYKAVNYIGLIPHLIEAVKELDKRTEEIAGLKKELAEMKEINKRMTALEAGLKSLLTENKSAIGKSQAK